MSKLTDAEKDKLDNTCGNLRVTKLGTHVKTLEDFVNEGVLDTRANTVVEAINELYGMIVNKDCEGITIPPPGFFTLFGNDEDGKLYVYYNNADYPPQFRHVETPGELEGTLYLYIADPLGENHYELEVGHYIAVRHLDNYYTKAQINSMFTVTVEKQTTAESGSFATYVVKQGGTQVGTKINIPKDYLVKSCSVKTCTTANVPVQGYKVGDKYIDWVINTRDGSANNEHLYLLVNEIAEPYKPDNSTITMSSGNVFSVKDGGITLVKLAPAVQNLINGKADANHAHGNITKEGKVGTNPNVPLITGTDGIVQAGSFGSGANNFARGNHGHSDLASIAYVDNQIASVEGDVVIDLESKADKDHTHNVVDLSNYMPKSSSGSGTAGYLKVLNIKTNQVYLDDPITFEIYHRQGTKPIYCSLKFTGGNNADPTIDSFTSEGSDNEVYVYKASTNNWQVIVKKIDHYDVVTVENINCNWGRWRTWATTPSNIFTHLDETITYLPSSTSTNPLVKASYRAFGGRKIKSGENLNNIKKQGFYFNDMGAEALNILNTPNGKAFFLLVEDWENNAYSVKQTFTSYSPNETYIRIYIDGTWGNWLKLSVDGHNHDSTYVKLSGGQTMTGNILIPSDADSTNNNATGHIPFAHTIQDTTKTVREILPTKKSFIGAVIGKNIDGSSNNQYDYVISARHRNGGGDGYKYGMYIRAGWSPNGNLIWSASNGGDYGAEKTILDSNNYSNYANKTTVDTALSSSSTNPVQNKVINTALSGKANSSHTHTKSQITDFPTSMTPTSHTHGNISNAGAVGTVANKPLITGTNGVISAGSFGTSANTFCQGNDSRITNAVKSACKIGFSTSSSAPGDAMNLSVAKGNPLYAFVRDANGNVPTGLAGGAFLFNGSPRAVAINSNGIMSLNMNTAGTFIIHAIVSDGEGYQVAAGFCRITVS